MAFGVLPLPVSYLYGYWRHKTRAKLVGLAVLPRGAGVDVSILNIHDTCGKDVHLLDHIKLLIRLHSLGCRTVCSRTYMYSTSLLISVHERRYIPLP